VFDDQHTSGNTFAAASEVLRNATGAQVIGLFITRSRAPLVAGSATIKRGGASERIRAPEEAVTPSRFSTLSVQYSFLVGNGLSCAFDPSLTSRAISERVFARLSVEDQTSLLELADLLSPETPDPPIGVDRGTFEALAGPVDRMASALLALDGLLATRSVTGTLATLKEASLALRVMYRRIVGLVLEEIDACCVTTGALTDERRNAWGGLNTFVVALIKKSGNCRPIFTTNYDSLLISAMLEKRGEVYDGFPGGALDHELRCWGDKPALYHLHGSIGWITDGVGELAKLELDDLRSRGLLSAWAAGRPVDQYPTVILGDQKTRTAGRYPFNVFYDGFRRELARSSALVAVGYSFGDRPISEIVARYLSESPDRKLYVWKRRGSAESFLNRLRSYVPKGASIDSPQVLFVGGDTAGCECDSSTAIDQRPRSPTGRLMPAEPGTAWHCSKAPKVPAVGPCPIRSHPRIVLRRGRMRRS
jgi:hypothetical protein